MSSTRLAFLAVFCAAILWSLDGVLRRSLYSLPAVSIIFAEHLLGSILLLPIIFAKRKKFLHIKKEQYFSILIVALFSGILGSFFYTKALSAIHYIPFSVVVLLQQLQPLFAMAAAAILLKERLSRRYLLLAALALVSAYALSFPDLHVNINSGTGTLIAALFAVAAAACWGISTALSKYSLKENNVIMITALRFFFTTGILFLYLFSQSKLIQLQEISLTQWQTLLAISCSTGLVALSIYYYGLKRIKASQSTIIELAWPLSAILYGSIFLQEQLTLSQSIAAISLLVSMYWITKEQLPQRR